MFGKQITRKCYDCNHLSTRNISTTYNVDKQLCITGIYCDKCGKNLCEHDEKVLENGRKNNAKIIVMMH